MDQDRGARPAIARTLGVNCRSVSSGRRNTRPIDLDSFVLGSHPGMAGPSEPKRKLVSSPALSMGFAVRMRRQVLFIGVTPGARMPSGFTPASVPDPKGPGCHRAGE